MLRRYDTSMPGDFRAARLTLKLFIHGVWQTLASKAYIACRPKVIIIVSIILEAARMCMCAVMASGFSNYGDFLQIYLLIKRYSSNAFSLQRPLYILAICEALVSLVSTVTFTIVIAKRQATRLSVSIFFGMITIGTAISASIVPLQSQALARPLDLEKIMKVRPDISPREVQGSWDNLIGGKLPLACFIQFLVNDCIQIYAILVRHIVSSPLRPPKKFQPLITKQRDELPGKETNTNIKPSKPEQQTNSGPLAGLFESCERQWESSEICLSYLVRQPVRTSLSEAAHQNSKSRYQAELPAADDTSNTRTTRRLRNLYGLSSAVFASLSTAHLFRD